MEITIFAKKRTTKEGKIFYNYLGKLKKKDGTEITAQIKFREACGNPNAADCPMNINIAKEHCNFSPKEVKVEENGELKTYTRNELWVEAWEKGSEYVDHSMDDFI